MTERPQPAGFGNCPRCAYAGGGTAAICFACAEETFEQLAEDRCVYCERPLEPDGSCGNPICNWDIHTRYFHWVWAISMRTGALRRAIDSYKVEGVEGWAWIFGRVLVGYLNAHREEFEDFDIIVPSPTYVGPGGRSFDHTASVIERAIVEDDGTWPFELGIITKSRPTTPFRGMGWQGRREIAEGELREALSIPDPDEVAGKDILVFDDVYTEGLTIREVARALKLAGANEVSEIVLARQPYGG